MYVSNALRDNFNERAEKVLQLIKDAGFSYNAIGVFGSYAREQYKTDSDIDFCVIVPSRPARNITGPLRDDADEFGAEIVFVTQNYFDSDNSHFASNLRRDFRRLA